MAESFLFRQGHSGSNINTETGRQNPNPDIYARTIDAKTVTKSGKPDVLEEVAHAHTVAVELDLYVGDCELSCHVHIVGRRQNLDGRAVKVEGDGDAIASVEGERVLTSGCKMSGSAISPWLKPDPLPIHRRHLPWEE